MKVGNICFFLVGIGMLVESLIGKKFLNTAKPAMRKTRVSGRGGTIACSLPA
jgi:hypothetical protein